MREINMNQSPRMDQTRRSGKALSLIVLAAAGLALGACSSSFGGGSSPPNTVVVPAGSRAVCSDGSAPPC
jgi:hypothetical protein